MRDRIIIQITSVLLTLAVCQCGSQGVVAPTPEPETANRELCRKACARTEECGATGVWGPPVCMDNCMKWFEDVVPANCLEVEQELLACSMEHYSCELIVTDEASSPRTDERRAVCLEPYEALTRCYTSG